MTNRNGDMTQEQLAAIGNAVAKGTTLEANAVPAFGFQRPLPVATRPAANGSLSREQYDMVGRGVLALIPGAAQPPPPKAKEPPSPEQPAPLTPDQERKLADLRSTQLADDINYLRESKGLDKPKPAVDPALTAAQKLADAKQLVLAAAEAKQAAKRRAKLARKLGL